MCATFSSPNVQGVSWVMCHVVCNPQKESRSLQIISIVYHDQFAWDEQYTFYGKFMK